MITTTDPHTRPDTDLQEAATRYRQARRTITHDPFARWWLRTPAGRPVAIALATIPALHAEIARLRRRLARTLLDLNNLIAAVRATLAAHHDGETDPLYYLRDELTAQGQLPPDDQDQP